VTLNSDADLVLHGLRKSFGSTRAVEALSINVQRGEFYSLLGPSGCGKTTTLRMIAGFEVPDEGSIRLAGEDITNLPPNKRRVNTVFQHYALFPHLNVEDNVAYGLRQERISRADLSRRLDEALATVRLKQLRSRYPRELSGGQQQRVALARALVKEPTVLLLDEPLAALDQSLRKAMQQELKKLQERVGITFVYVTHDQEEALTLSDRIAVMNGGRLLQEGSPREIYELPRSRFVADFIGRTNFLQGVLETVGERIIVREKGTGAAVSCAAGDSLRAGMEVSVAIRPERLYPAESVSQSQGMNVIDGRLISSTYLGDVVHYQIEVGDGLLTMQRQNDPADPAAAWRAGDPVQVMFEEESALVLVDDERVAGEEDRKLLEAE
jgi:spermidine/putrescine ABC transporter ATP-binding subunit